MGEPHETEKVNERTAGRTADRTTDRTGKQTVLVTGATGFLGEYLVRRLVKEYRVLALGRNQEKGRGLEAYGDRKSVV